jgi:O-acetyl-ADP-ribose deacetylase (regulator of RNase III)|tara:strand:- start:205 stop:642 length:438 start_codon:yes stop_codon:yes gene_type:complete
MIYEVEGDVLMSLARKLQEKFPSMRDQFIEWCEETNPEPGDIWLWGGNTKTRVLNLIVGEAAEPELGRSSRPNKIAVHRALRAVNKLVIDERFNSIAIPRIGSGVGGIDWLEVRGMMASQLGELLIPLFVDVTALDGMLAHEPGM